MSPELFMPSLHVHVVAFNASFTSGNCTPDSQCNLLPTHTRGAFQLMHMPRDDHVASVHAEAISSNGN